MDTYLQLQHQDGFANPGPLYLTLCTKIKFSHRLASLVIAAAEGKGLSHLRLWDNREDSEELSELQQGQSFTGATEVFGEVFTSTEVRAGSPVGQLGKTDESRSATSLNDGVVAESEPGRTPEAIRFPRDQGATALASTTGEPDAHNHNAIDVTSQGQQQTVPDPTLEGNRQTLQGPESPSLPAENGAESGDTIEYEDEDNVDQEASVGSSTLQGDVSETAAEETQLHHPELIYTADSNHDGAAEEYTEEQSEVPYSVDENSLTVGDVYQRDHSIACGSERDVRDDNGIDTQDGELVELTEPEHGEHWKHQSDHLPESEEAEEDDEQLDFDQTLQHANHGLLLTTNEVELPGLQHPTPSIPDVDHGYGRATADSDKIAGQGSLYHKQHLHEGANEAYTAEQVSAEEASEDKIVQAHATGVVRPAIPEVQSGDGAHNLPAPASDVDEITYEEDEIEEAIDTDLIRPDVNASPKFSVSTTLKRVRSSPEEDNAQADFLGKTSTRG